MNPRARLTNPSNIIPVAFPSEIELGELNWFFICLSILLYWHFERAPGGVLQYLCMEFLSLSDLCKQSCHHRMSMLLFTWIGWPIPLNVVSILRSGVAPSHDQPLHLAAQQTHGLHYVGIVLPIFTFHHKNIGSTEWYHCEFRPDIEWSSKLIPKCNHGKQCSRRMCTSSISWSKLNLFDGS